MKNERKPFPSDNIIPFPNSDKRLLEKGIDQLEQKKYTEAIESFEEAIRFAPENGDVYIGLFLAYYEKGEFQAAKDLAKDMLHRGIGEYIETIDLYLMALVELHEYEEIHSVLEVLFQEMVIPEKKKDHFLRLLQFSKKMLEEIGERGESIEEDFDAANERTPLRLGETEDLNELVVQIGELSYKNISPYMDEINSYLLLDKGHPFIKTLLVNLLREQKVSKETKIVKFGRSMEFTPALLEDVRLTEQKREIEDELKRKLEHEDPILMQQAISLLERHNFLVYPFSFEPDRHFLWAAAYHYTALHFNGISPGKDEICAIYGTDIASFEQACSFIAKLEEISYPII